jgi:hypothetical protein
MSLSLPESFKRPNIIENWVVLLGYDKGITDSGETTAEVVNTTETEIDVTDGSKFASGDFIFIRTERMKVSSVSSNTLTVVRGINKTPSSSMNSGEIVYHDNFKCVSFADTKFEGEYSDGVISSEPSIRESINLEKSTSKTGNVSISVPNFNYQGSPFSKELFGGTRTYINRECLIYIVPNEATLKFDSLLIYSGRLEDISHDNDSIKLSIVSRNPIDGVEIPQTKTSKDNYFPIAYGDYTPSTASLNFGSGSDADDYRKRKTLYPIPVEERRRDTIFSLTGTRSTGANAFPNYYEKSTDTFHPLANDSSNPASVDSENESYGDGYAVRFHQNLLKNGLFKVVEFVSKTQGTRLNWGSNEENAFDGEFINTSSHVQCSFDGSFVLNDSASIEYGLPQLTGYPSLITTNLVIQATFTLGSIGSTSGEIRLQLIDESFGASDVKGYWSLTGATSTTTFNVTGAGTLNTAGVSYLSDTTNNSSEYLASGNGWGETVKLKLKLIRQSGNLDGEVTGFVRIYDIAVQTRTQLDFSETTKTGKTVAYQTLDDIEYVYSGANGLTDNGWNSSSAITEIHEAHRDLLQRFTNFTNRSNSDYTLGIHPKNWISGTNINSIKDWKIRYWINRPTSLKKVLEDLQYNGGFIGRYNGQGDYEYIFIPDSITANYNLTKEDISSIDISLTPFDKVITSMDIEYEKHPATSGYVSEVNSSNSSSISAYNVDSKENKKQIKLNALVSAPATSPTTLSSGNVNDDFYTYYNNILGEVKHLVSFNVVNPSKYGIDVGDFLTFSNMTIEPFGGSWSGKNFIVVSVSRKRGQLKIKAREV